MLRAVRAAASRHPALPFWAVFAAFAAYANLAYAALLPAPIPTEDTYGYLIASLVRTIGYPLFLSAYRALFPAWDFLPLVQLNLLLAGVAALCFAVARVTRSHAAAWLVLVIVAAAARMLLSAAYLMTEAVFAAALMLHAAAACIAFAQRSRRAALAAGVFLAAAVLVKSVAIVLAAPVLLFAVFSPPGWRRTLLAVLLPPLAAWAVPSAVNLARVGVFESSVAGGYALAGHVGWAIRAHPGSPHPELAARIESRLGPVLARRPAWQGSRNAYVEHTANEYNTLLWVHIVPETARFLGPGTCPSHYYNTCTWLACASKCMVASNRILLDLSRDAILRQPREYAYHVFAHGHALWTAVFLAPTDLLRGVNARADELPHYYRPDVTISRPLLEPVPPFHPPGERASRVSRIEDSVVKRLLDVATLREPAGHLARALERLSAALPWIGLAASALVLVLRRLPSTAAAFCYLGLCLNAYFLGTALVQPVLPRYAWPMQGLAAALLVTGTWAAIGAILNAARARRRS